MSDYVQIQHVHRNEAGYSVIVRVTPNNGIEESELEVFVRVETLADIAGAVKNQLSLYFSTLIEDVKTIEEPTKGDF